MLTDLLRAGRLVDADRPERAVLFVDDVGTDPAGCRPTSPRRRPAATWRLSSRPDPGSASRSTGESRRASFEPPSRVVSTIGRSQLYERSCYLVKRDGSNSGKKAESRRR